MRFKVGQEVVCIKNGVWVLSSTGRTIPDNRTHPKYNDVVTVDGYASHDGIYLKGYNYITRNGRQSFDERRFAPILENLDEIKEVLKEPIMK